jgi:hypothetical protein
MRLFDLVDLQRLKRIANRRVTTHDIKQLEKDFLAFSQVMPETKLSVRLPKLLKLEESESKKIREILDHVEQEKTPTPSFIDFSGAFSYVTSGLLVFTTTQQINADHYSSNRSYLDPLLEKICTDGINLLTDITINDVLYGQVNCSRGNLDLDEITIFPEKFRNGPYLMKVSLDTVSGNVNKFIQLGDLLENFSEDPKTSLLDFDKVKKTTGLAMSLRESLGSLSRYELPRSQEFKVEVDTYRIRTNDTTLFYLYSAEEKKNILVHFGKSPFQEGQEPKNLLIFDGDDYQHTLVELMNLGFFVPSLPVLEKRIEDLEELYNNAARTDGKSLLTAHRDYQGFLGTLQKTKDYFGYVFNENAQLNHLKKSAPEIAEFVLYPKNDDPLIHELLPRLSWNKSLRKYHNTSTFISQFEKSDDDSRLAVLSELSSSIMFSNQENNDVNVWLYQNYQELCSKVGIGFDVVDNGKQ